MNSKLIIPDLGVDAAEVVEIAVQVGDSIQAEQDILTLETDKASMEVPASVGGTISELSIAVGDSVTSGQVIGSVADGSAELYSAGSQGGTQSTDSHSAGEAKGKTGSTELPGSAELYSAGEAKGQTQSAESHSAGEDKGRTGSAELYSAKKDQAKTETPTAIPLELSAPEATAQLLIPDLGVDSAEVVEIAITVGDSIEPEQEILTLETDKASMEVPANVGGTVQELSIAVGDSVHSGQTIGLVLGAGVGAPSYTRQGSQGATRSAELYSAGKEQGETPSTESPGSAELYSAGEDKGKPREAETQEHPPTTPQIYAGPAVRKLARELGVDLGQIQGSGTRGRIVKQDVQAHVKQRLQQPAATAPSNAPAAPPLPEIDFSQFGSIEVIAMSKVQRLTAAAMSSSLQVAPQVSHHDKADITALEQLRKDSKEFAAEHGVKLTALPLLIKACALALQQFPEFNSSLVGDNIIRKHYIHIGIAVDSPHGLFVPVIRDVDKKSVFAIAREAAELAAKAQSKTLKPADMQGGCFSVSSLGALGGEYFTPIVNWPEAAILGVCQARMQPLHIDGEFSARLMLPLSLSYDHRLINGAAAARFTNHLIKLLAQPSFIMA